MLYTEKEKNEIETGTQGVCRAYIQQSTDFELVMV